MKSNIKTVGSVDANKFDSMRNITQHIFEQFDDLHPNAEIESFDISFNRGFYEYQIDAQEKIE